MAGRRQQFGEFARYVAVGVLNTLVTLAVIVVLKSLLGCNPWWSNAAGYGAGVVNSFLWNRGWVFHARQGNATRQAAWFLAGFAVCYSLQLLFVWGTTEFSPIGEMMWSFHGYTLSGYGAATLIGMGLYTVVNFLFNRLIAFRQ